MHLKLNIIENEKVIQTVIKETNTELAELSSAIEDFRMLVNAVFTEKVLNNQVLDTSDEESSSTDEENECPKKKRK